MIDDLAPGPVALDSAVFIYLIEEHPVFLGIVEPLFRAVDAGRVQAVSSTLTLLEVLVVPYRLGHTALAERYEALLTRGRGLRLVELEQGLLRGAARLRAAFGVKTPDALQLAAALASNCRTFVTNDRRLPEIPNLRVLQVSDYAGRR